MKSSYLDLAQDIAAKAFNCDVNLDETERVMSAVGGGALLLTNSSLRSLRGLLATAVGASLVYRGLTGHCPFYSALGVNTCSERSTGKLERTWTGSSASERAAAGLG